MPKYTSSLIRKNKSGWTNEHTKWLADHATMPVKERHALFNETFGKEIKLNTFKSFCVNHGIHPGRRGRFTSENAKPWAKGMPKEKFWERYSDESKARMINAPLKSNRIKKIGDIVRKSGETYMVMSTDYSLPLEKRRIPYRRWVYEQHHGSIPTGHIIIHLDGDNKNFAIDNLCAIPLKYKAQIAKMGGFSQDPEITRTSIMICELKEVIR